MSGKPAFEQLHVASTVAERDARLLRGPAVFSTRPRQQCRAPHLSVPAGTVWLGEGTLETEQGTSRLSTRQHALVRALADGGWHSDDVLLAALDETSKAALNSLVARLRRRLGPCIERRYGRAWRLVPAGAQRPDPELLEALQTQGAAGAEELAQRLQVSAGAIRVRIHRMRQQGFTIESTEAGYHAPEDVESRLRRALATEALVVLWGPIGVGKTHLARTLGRRVVVVESLDRDRVHRRLARLAEAEACELCIDGLIDASPFSEDLATLVSRGFSVLVTARLPPDTVVGLQAVSMEPWTEAQLQQVFPGQETRSWDGLPLGHLGLAARRQHVLRGLPDGAPGFDELVDQIQGRHLGLARSLGWCVTPDRPARPVLHTLMAAWTDATWEHYGASLFERLYSRLEVAQGGTPEEQDAVAKAISELQRRGLPSHDLIWLAANQDVELDDATIQHAIARCSDGERLADLHYVRWILDYDEHAIYRAIETTSRPGTAHDYRVQLAYHLWRQDEAAARELYGVVGAWLESRPPGDHLWLRCEHLSALTLRDPFATTPEDLLAALAEADRRHLLERAERARWASIQIRWALGRAFLWRGQLDPARNTLELNLSELGAQSATRGAMDLLEVYLLSGDLERWDEAWQILQPAPLNAAWQQYGQRALALRLMAEGRLDEARACLGEAHRCCRAVLDVLEAPWRSTDAPTPLQRAVADVLRGARELASLEPPEGCAIRGDLLRHVVGRSLSRDPAGVPGSAPA